MMAVPSTSARIKECCVKYQLFPNSADRNENGTVSELYDNLVVEYITKLAPFLQKYIWQNQPFVLRPVIRHDKESCLEGSTDFGENIEDEWFIVFLLFHLTKDVPGLVVKVEDSDGEFLLIEAAEQLPKWVNPETSENRVYIYQGFVHLVPLATSPAEVTPAPGGTPSIPQALMTIRSHKEVTKASQAIQDAILNRIKGYPGRISELQHRAHCFVPSNLASLLNHSPALVAPAVAAFYHRDSIDLKACRAMKYFPPETRVMREVTFTRCLYAQLVQQQFEPDRCTGWKMPNSRSPSYLSHSLGMKLACGFEILACRAISRHSDSSSANADVDPELDSRWKSFLSSLTAKGYFKGELEGSRLYKELLQQAYQFYTQSVQPDTANISSDSRDIGAHILNLLRSVDTDYEQLRSEEPNLKAPDDDSWLNLTPDLLDSILDEYAKRTCFGDSHDQPGAKEKELAEAITGTLKDFVQGTSGVDGVDTSFHKKTQRKGKSKNNNNMDFDPEGFTDAMKSILYFKEPDSDSLSSSSMSGYSEEEEEVAEVALQVKDVLDQRPEIIPRKKNKKHTVASAAVDEMREYMEQMDREVASTEVGQSFERIPVLSDHKSDQLNDSIEEESDDFQPVDIDLTALKNILESYNSQGGLPGPASNLLQSMGLSLPQDANKT